MVAGEIGEGGGMDRQAFGPELRQAVARCFESGVSDAFARQARHVGEEGDDVGCGEAGRDLIVGSGDPKRSDRGGMVPRHPPQLTGQLDVGRLAVGAGDGDHPCRKGREEPGREPGEGAPRLRIGEVSRTVDLRFRPRNHRHRAGLHGLCDEVLAIEAGALKGAEHGAGRDLAVVDGEAGHLPVVIQSGEISKAHRLTSSPARTEALRPDWRRGCCPAPRPAPARSATRSWK
jgi:hypothetical protein